MNKFYKREFVSTEYFVQREFDNQNGNTYWDDCGGGTDLRAAKAFIKRIRKEHPNKKFRLQRVRTEFSYLKEL